MKQQIRKSFALGALAAATALASTQAVADFEGGYVGARMGVFTSVVTEVSDFGVDKQYFGAETMPLGRLDLVGGYGFMVNPTFYLGGELGLTLLNNFDEDVIKDGGDALSIEGGTGFSLRGIAGYVPGPNTMLYGTLGYQQRNYEFADPDESEDEDFTGVGFGFGLQQKLGGNLMLTAEAFHISYSKEDLGGDVDLQPTETTFDLGIAFRF